MLRSPLVLAAVSCAMLLPALPVFADPAAPAAQTSQPAADTATRGNADADQRRVSDRQAFLDARLAFVRAGLELSPDQEKLWAPVDSALRDLVTARQGLRHPNMMTDGATRLKARGDHLVALGRALQKLADAGSPLAATMTPDQKRRLPRLARHLPRRALQLALGFDQDGPGGGVDFDRRRFWRRDGGEGWMRRGGDWMQRGGDRDNGMHQDTMERHRENNPGRNRATAQTSPTMGKAETTRTIAASHRPSPS